MDQKILGIPSLHLLERAFDALADNPFYVKDRNLRYIAANDAMLDLCGVRHRHELLGRTAFDVFISEGAARFDVDGQRVLSGVSIVDRIDLIQASKRPPTWLMLSEFPFVDQTGSIAGIVGVGRRLDKKLLTLRSCEGLSRALKYLQLNFDKPLDCGRLADCAGVSVAQLERIFRKILRVTPRGYQHRVRMSEAKRLLLGTERIADIGLACGYGDHSSFSRRFISMTGVTPSTYRTMHRSSLQR